MLATTVRSGASTASLFVLSCECIYTHALAYTRDMAAKRYQLKLIGHGKLQHAGTHVLRITPNATTSSIEEQVKELFELPPDSRVKVFECGIDDVEECAQDPTIVSISMHELVKGVLDYFSHDMEPSFLATSKPEVLVDVVSLQVAKPVTATSSKTTSKGSGGYTRTPWAGVLNQLWPFVIPRYVCREWCDLGVTHVQDCTL